MKPIKLFFAILAICYFTSTAGYSSNNEKDALLWKVSGNGLEKPSFILGTLHLASKSKLDSIPGANKALENCEQVVGELVMSEMMAQVSKIQQAGMMSADTTYQMLYTEEEFKKVSEGIKEYIGVDLNQVGMLKPSMIQTTIVMFMYQKFFSDYNPNEAMDNYVQQYASTEGKDIIGLETIEDQINALFNTSSLKRQAEILLCLFEHTEESLVSAAELIDAYNRADLTTLEAMINDTEGPCSGNQAENDALINNRNKIWAEKLPGIMAEKSCFIAVGAGHIVGESGILTLLEKAGFKVEPVK